MKDIIKFFHIVILCSLILFIAKFCFDFYSTYNAKTAENEVVYFKYDFYKSPFKYIYFKNISEIDKEYVWVESGNGVRIILIEYIYFNKVIFANILESKEVHIK